MKWSGLSGLLAVLSAGLLGVALTTAAPTVAHASHVPNCFGLHPTNTPTDGNDRIFGTEGDDVLAGGAGDDTIVGNDGSDTLCGNDGADRIHGTNGNDSIDGGRGADLLTGDLGHDLAVGGDDYDHIYGASGNDFAGSNDGNDTLYAGSMDVQLPEWPQTCETNGEFAFARGPVENGDATLDPWGGKYNALDGGEGYDDLVGADRVDYMSGAWRGDDLYGFAGRDNLQGDRASDCLSGGPDADLLWDGDPWNAQPDDSDTLWGGGERDSLDAKDGDGFDSLNGGLLDVFFPPFFLVDECTSDQGDVVIHC
jgi:Ca2+-binding RTX toxin-like protein